ncbi:unnamed protein product, partial [Rodentolepis nana]|uniref:GAGE domain-containing protein n=1 Tax=Rodentolepis nana TaxID=102285 RepID=A0A0R3T9K5_RODNA
MEKKEQIRQTQPRQAVDDGTSAERRDAQMMYTSSMEKQDPKPTTQVMATVGEAKEDMPMEEKQKSSKITGVCVCYMETEDEESESDENVPGEGSGKEDETSEGCEVSEPEEEDKEETDGGCD